MKGEEEYDYTEEVEFEVLQSVSTFDGWIKREHRTVIQPIFFDFSRLYIFSPGECVDQSISKIDYMLSLLAMPFSFELKGVEFRFADTTLCLTNHPSSCSFEVYHSLVWDVHSIKMTCFTSYLA